MALINALTTVANAKIMANIPTADTSYDAAIELLINRASASVTNYLGHKLARGTYTEHIPATSRQLLIVKEFPIISVTSLSNNGIALTLNTDYRLDAQDAASGMIYKQDGWNPVNLITGLTGDIVAAERTIDVVYVAGYYLPADPLYVAGADTSLPLDISGVVDELVSSALLRIMLKAQGLSSYSEGGISYGWKASANSIMMGLSDEHALVLNNYKRFIVA
jgi:hypothetical protein